MGAVLAAAAAAAAPPPGAPPPTEELCTSAPVTPSRLAALLFDCSHDNEVPAQKRSAEDALPSAALIAFAAGATGSTRGYVRRRALFFFALLARPLLTTLPSPLHINTTPRRTFSRRKTFPS